MSRPTIIPQYNQAVRKIEIIPPLTLYFYRHFLTHTHTQLRTHRGAIQSESTICSARLRTIHYR